MALLMPRGRWDTSLERTVGVVLPEAANGLISQAIFMFEYNVRHGTVIGIVGAGGIGYYINLYLRFLQRQGGGYPSSSLLLFSFGPTLHPRLPVPDEQDVKRPSWWTVFCCCRVARGDEDDDHRRDVHGTVGV